MIGSGIGGLPLIEKTMRRLKKEQGEFPHFLFGVNYKYDFWAFKLA